jgi:hypothetical protein
VPGRKSAVPPGRVLGGSGWVCVLGGVVVGGESAEDIVEMGGNRK